MRHSNRETGWLSRNRWGLGLLPLATVCALAASSDRVKPYWWDADLHEPVPAAQGEWLGYSQPYTLDDGEHVMSLRARLDSVHRLSAEEAAGATGYVLPAGAVAVRVTLSVQADPATPLTGCSMALRDADGNRYTYVPTLVADGQPTSPCVPADAPGPNATFGELSMPGPDEQQRPASYTVTPVWVVPAAATFTEADLWWDLPEYIAFRASSSKPSQTP
ncbi:hypothetical protein [Kineosporia sp. NBRC 101731]|uniref:hypothetical protein n=1 Tax=Kineosporia sp. NBRC 101731 TaxID=3032199 RepID=UPI0024A077D5|nr:hypothetical protein [Kineosporia sp. NBRC 101731]GLY32980.1 hypothetical protein Kisp02_63450 [Kineosporia sp. NBRC 101731]